MTSTEQARFRRAQWRILLATMFCYLFFYTGRQTFGFAIPGISEELGLSKAQLGLASGVLFWCYAVGQAINGNLGDKFGGRQLMAGGAMISCLLNWVVSFGQNLLSLLVPWGMNGLAQSMGWAPGSRVISNWWNHQERGKAYGLYVFAAGMSSVLAFTTSLLVLETWNLDWRWIFRLPVLLLLVGGGVYYLVARNCPADLGFSQTIEPGKSPPPETEDSRSRYLGALSNPKFMVASLAIGFQSFARYALIIWVPVYFLGDNWKKSEGTAWISIALPVGMALGALISGWLSDRVFQSRRWPLITLFMFLAGLSAFAMSFLGRDQQWLALLLLFLAGFFVYGPQAGFWALCPDLLGPHRAGTGTGIMNFFAYAFAGLEGPMVGHWIDQNGGDASVVFPIVGTACILSACIAPFIRK